MSFAKWIFYSYCAFFCSGLDVRSNQRDLSRCPHPPGRPVEQRFIAALSVHLREGVVGASLSVHLREGIVGAALPAHLRERIVGVVRRFVCESF
jgi:hypothetical protein